jgi:hypothetical protein
MRPVADWTCEKCVRAAPRILTSKTILVPKEIAWKRVATSHAIRDASTAAASPGWCSLILFPRRIHANHDLVMILLPVLA